jgi:tetratricopeptide (TPR) repeat protein
MRAMHAAGGSVSLSDCVGPEPSGDERICAGKGAAVFGMLKELIGEEAYCAALRATAEAHGGEATGLGALMQAFERESGQNLDWFFYEWITRDDLPSYALDYDAARAGRGTYIVHGTILQQGEFYRTPVPLTIDLGGWSYEETIPIESSRQQFTLRTEAEPLQIVVDGRELIPKIDASEQALIHYERGSLAASSGRWKVAADELGAAALLEGNDAMYVHAYGEALVRLGRVTEGTRELEHAIELAPDDYDYRLGIASLYLRLSRYGPALRHLDVYVRGRPEDRAGHIKRTVALVGLGRLDEAAATLELARDLPEGAAGSGALDADFFIASGLLLEARGETQAAIRSYEAALAAYPVSDEARRRLSAIMESNRQETP